MVTTRSKTAAAAPPAVAVAVVDTAAVAPSSHVKRRKKKSDHVSAAVVQTAPFLSLPLEILVQIAAQSHPIECVNLAFTCKALHSWLASPRADYIWLQSFEQVMEVTYTNVYCPYAANKYPKLPTPPTSLSWLSYANILLVQRCSDCSRELSTIPPPLRISGYSLVNKCYRCCHTNSMQSKRKIKDAFKNCDLPAQFFNSLPSASDSWNGKGYDFQVCEMFLRDYTAFEASVGFNEAKCKEWLDKKAEEQALRYSASEQLWSVRKRGRKWVEQTRKPKGKAADAKEMKLLDDQNLEALRCHLKLKLKVKIRSSDVQDAAATAIFLKRLYSPLSGKDLDRLPTAALEDVLRVREQRLKIEALVPFEMKGLTKQAMQLRVQKTSSLITKLRSRSSVRVPIASSPTLAEMMQLDSISTIITDSATSLAEVDEASVNKAASAFIEFSNEMRSACIALCNNSMQTRNAKIVADNSVFALFNCTGASSGPHEQCCLKPGFLDDVLQHPCLHKKRLKQLTDGFPHTLEYLKQHPVLRHHWASISPIQVIPRNIAMIRHDRQAVENAKILIGKITAAGFAAPVTQAQLSTYRFTCSRLNISCFYMTFTNALEHMRKYRPSNQAAANSLDSSSDDDEGSVQAGRTAKDRHAEIHIAAGALCVCGGYH